MRTERSRVEAVPQPGLERSYWLRDALEAEPAATSRRALADDDVWDVVIIGGGYTGMWTAYFITDRDPGVRVAIVEQDICGGGASGRNGGFLHGWWDQLPLLVDLFGPDDGLAIARAADASVEGTRAFCERHAVDAWFTLGGYLRVSASAAQDGEWRTAVATCRRLGVADAYLELGPDEVRRRCASPEFRGGALMPNAATIQPARLARGLRRVLLERGVTVLEGVRAAPPQDAAGGRQRVVTGAGPLVAEQVVLALNAWGAGWPSVVGRVVAWGSYIVLTEPAPDRLAALGWTRGEAIADSRFTVNYFRTTPDGRVAFGAGVGQAGYGGRIGAAFERDRRAAERAVAGLHRLLPPFRDVPIAEAWGGPIDVSPDRLPLIGSSSNGRVHHAVGYSGNGVGPAHLAGRMLAGRICGTDDELMRLPLLDRRVRRFPPEPARSIGARVIRRALIRQDELADRGRRAGPLVRALGGLPRRLGYRLGPESRKDRG